MYPFKYKNKFGYIRFPDIMKNDDVFFTDIFGNDTYLSEGEFLESDFKRISFVELWKECERVSTLCWKAYPGE